MFDQLFQRPATIARHSNAPYAEQRQRYLSTCKQQGDPATTLTSKATALFRIARALSGYPDLRQVTMEQVQAAAYKWKQHERPNIGDLDRPPMSHRDVGLATDWLRFLRSWPAPVELIPFRAQLDQYCQWAKEERGFTAATVDQSHWHMKRFLCWYGTFDRPLMDLQANDIDAYLTHRSNRGWCRRTINSVAKILRMFFRYAGQQGWTSQDLASIIQAPRIYASESLPAVADWRDVRRMFCRIGCAESGGRPRSRDSNADDDLRLARERSGGACAWSIWIGNTISCVLRAVSGAIHKAIRSCHRSAMQSSCTSKRCGIGRRLTAKFS
jgi:hypothetical protein